MNKARLLNFLCLQLQGCSWHINKTGQNYSTGYDYTSCSDKRNCNLHQHIQCFKQQVISWLVLSFPILLLVLSTTKSFIGGSWGVEGAKIPGSFCWVCPCVSFFYFLGCLVVKILQGIVVNNIKVSKQ